MGTTPVFSIEFFPPRTAEGVEKLRVARRQLSQLRPAFCSVTFGAGGSTREGTLATVLEIRREGTEAAPHISCIGSTRASIREVLRQYREHGIRHLVASGETTWHGFAEAIFDEASERGLIARRPTVTPIATSDYPTRAVRPAYSVLDTTRLRDEYALELPDWRDALARTLA